MHSPTINIETPRLIIRELLPMDDKGMFEMDSDPEVHRFVGGRPSTSIDESRNVIEYVRGQYRNDGIGRWAITLKDSGAFVGWTGFKIIHERINGHFDFYDFGYRLARRYWRQGYATESARAALNFGLDVLGITEVYAMTDVDNFASRRILEKLGFQLIEVFNYDGEPHWRSANQPTTWYKLGSRLRAQ